jgi:outer membrane protein TolC
MKNKWTSTRIHRFLFAVLLLPTSLLAEPITLRHAVELALKHATGIGIATADEQHASASYRVLRNSYIPQLTAGAGIGWSDGFPLSLEGAAPSLFSISAQSALINPALRDFIHAAQADVTVSNLQIKDQRNQIIQDTVLTYAELAKWEQRLSRLHESEATAARMEAAVTQRVKEGIDSEVDRTKARLSVARVRLRLAEARGAADVLREHLSKLIGLPLASIEIDPDSLPALPLVKPEETMDEASRVKAADANPSVQAAVEHARSQYLRVKGEHRSLWPSVDFAGQFAVFDNSFNNYQRFYTPGSFQINNGTVGVAIHFPFFNYAQHARVQEAESEAVKAKKQAEATRNQVSEETLRLERSVTQMQVARDVVELEYEIARTNVEAVRTRTESSTANLHDLDDAQTQASERLIKLQDISFELERSQVALMRATGNLETWAVGPR